MKEFKARQISTGYGTELILDKLDVDIPKGKITGIIGPNGCGKSTLLKTIGRIKRMDSGTVLLDGKCIYDYTSREFARQLSLLPQTPSAPEGLSAEEIVSYGRYAYQKGLGRLKEKDREIIRWALSVTGLEGFEKRSVENMSGGQRQRVFIAMALAQQADIILLDEPTTYLDISYQLEILELLKRLNRSQGCTIVMVLHDINLASHYCDNLIALKCGKIICSGDPDTVMTKDIMRRVYEIETEIATDPYSNKPVCVSFRLMKA